MSNRFSAVYLATVSGLLMFGSGVAEAQYGNRSSGPVYSARSQAPVFNNRTYTLPPSVANGTNRGGSALPSYAKSQPFASRAQAYPNRIDAASAMPAIPKAYSVTAPSGVTTYHEQSPTPTYVKNGQGGYVRVGTATPSRAPGLAVSAVDLIGVAMLPTSVYYTGKDVQYGIQQMRAAQGGTQAMQSASQSMMRGAAGGATKTKP